MHFFAPRLGIIFLCLFPSSIVRADPGAEFNARCAQKIHASLTDSLSGMSPSANPKANVDALLESAEFIEHFALFLNTAFNDDPTEALPEDVVYHLTKHVLEKKKPYADLFTGRYDFTFNKPATGLDRVEVVASPQGVGYFETRPWKLRYMGNEENGVRLMAAYRILNNMTGLELSAVTIDPNKKNTAAGRRDAPCNVCHYNSWFALDKVASVLGTVDFAPQLNLVKFNPPDGSVKQILGDIPVRNTRELTEAVVKSENFSFQACRLSFRFLTGRNENVCEEKLFDQCMTNFKKTGKIQDALKTYILDANFCQ